MVKRAHRIVRAWSRVRVRERVAEETYWLELTAPEIAAQAAPGQFVMVGFGASAWGIPFLPRPNSVAAVRGEHIGLLIRVYGAGSRRLTALKPGEEALVLGPLGTHFELNGARRILCVAGGVGLAPFLLLPAWPPLVSCGAEVRLLYGERQAAAVFDPGKLREISGLEAEIWTEDGSLGSHGRVTDGVDLNGVDLVLTCGPTPMLKAVRALAVEAGVACQLAVEEHMACGVGTCIGCAIETVDPETGEAGYSLVCSDGPVFPAERLRW
ncbi:MAG: dihydroorotate dehydrogenase electron transfer subunit [Gemmatimonadota bacterium]|nr:MAG: dihydroorotate dehydrogenase electron transfer subunit [Gemmatimonadota bacterium]